MATKAGVWSVISRILHALLVLVLTAILLRSVYYAFSLLAAGPRTHITTQHEEFEDRADPDAFVEDPMNPRIPTVQEIAQSLNTHWMSFHPWHCKNVCETSWTACTLKLCHDVPGVRRW